MLPSSHLPNLPKAPWTCCWGGVSLRPNAFPPCHHPVLAVKLRRPRAGDCEHCPYWVEWDPSASVDQKQPA